MSTSREVQVDVLPPLPEDSRSPVPSNGPTLPAATRFYHPASGAVILGLDWFTFGTDILTEFLALPVMIVLSFLTTFAIVYQIQTRLSKDSPKVATGKALLGAVLVAIPLPITGTMLGAGILALSGLPHHPVEIFRRLISSRSLIK